MSVKVRFKDGTEERVEIPIVELREQRQVQNSFGTLTYLDEEDAIENWVASHYKGSLGWSTC